MLRAEAARWWDGFLVSETPPTGGIWGQRGGWVLRVTDGSCAGGHRDMLGSISVGRDGVR